MRKQCYGYNWLIGRKFISFISSFFIVLLACKMSTAILHNYDFIPFQQCVFLCIRHQQKKFLFFIFIDFPVPRKNSWNCPWPKYPSIKKFIPGSPPTGTLSVIFQHQLVIFLCSTGNGFHITFDFPIF